jgi:hypothetical protein
MRTKIFIGALVAVFLLSFVMVVKNAKADGILFPFITKSDSVSTIISVVNTAAVAPDTNQGLHYQYWYKKTTANGQCEGCESYSFRRPTSKDDIVCFDASGNINDGMALYDEEARYNDDGFDLNVEAPRRAFLIVDNDDLVNTAADGTIYGEAMVLELAGGSAWGYVAYNPEGQADNDYQDGNDVLGEVIGVYAVNNNEQTQVVLLSPDQGTTRFFLTPICDNVTATGQRDGDLDGQMFFFADEPGMFDNDENVIDFSKKKDVVCTAGADLEHLIGEGAFNEFCDTGGQGWAYVRVTDNVAASCSEVQNDEGADISGMMIGKLKYSTAGITFADTTIPGTLNNFVLLRDSSSHCSGGGINIMHNEVY